jgi:5-methylthioadenosine/S-adenosylhomocysteine deaminase
MMIWAADFARKHDLPLHIHLSETRKEVEDCKAAHGGLTPVEYLESIGVLGPNLLAAHCLWLSEHDIELLAEYGVHCIHNINSNTKLSSGYKFLYNELRDAGVNICIGTDGCASSNNLDILEAMKTSALFQKAWREDPKALPLHELLDMATINGAKALRLNSGRLVEGALADISIVDTDTTYFLSPGPFLANLVYSAHSDCIDSVIANGKFVMRGREIPGEKEILREARKALSKIIID